MSSVKIKNIVETLTSLNKSRSDEIKSLLTSVCSNSKKLFINIHSIQNQYIMSVSERSEKGYEYRNRFFNSKNPNVVCSYYEIWIKLEKDTYYLDRAYFHLYTYSEDTSNYEGNKEYILLHADPNDLDSPYKRGPHLHFKCATEPIPKAHIALNNENLTDLLKSRKNITKSLKSAIDMLCDEIINQVE